MDDQLLMQDLISDSSDSSSNRIPYPLTKKFSSQHHLNDDNTQFIQISNTSRSLNTQRQPLKLQVNDDNKSPQRVEYVPLKIFKSVIEQLESKLQDLEERLENNEKINLNQQLNNIRQKTTNEQHCSSTPLIDDTSLGHEEGSEHKNRSPITQDNSLAEKQNTKSPISQTRTKSFIERNYQPNLKTKDSAYQSPQSQQKALTPQREDTLISRLNLFEKRQKTLDDKMLKMNKDNENLRRDYDKKMETAIRKNTDEQDKTKLLRSELITRIEELGQNQKSFIQHLHSVGLEINENAVLITTLKEQFEVQDKDVSQKLNQFELSYQKNDEDQKDLRHAQNSVENDLFLILRNYKEMLTEVLKVQIMAEDIKTLYQMIQEYE